MYSDRLYGGIEFEPHNDEAMVDAWTIPSMIPVTNWGIRGAKFAAGIYPYARDIWNGRDLLFHKPFDKMSKEEHRAYYKQGKTYYKKNIQPYVEHNKIIGDVHFPGNQSAKPYFEFMEQYPFLRYNIKNAKVNTFLPNNKLREDANGFDNLRVNWLGKDYAYQVKNNAYDGTKNFHNIKPYEKLELDKNKIKDMLDFHLRNKNGGI